MLPQTFVFKWNVNASAYQDILENFMLPTLGRCVYIYRYKQWVDTILTPIDQGNKVHILVKVDKYFWSSVTNHYKNQNFNSVEYFFHIASNHNNILKALYIVK